MTIPPGAPRPSTSSSRRDTAFLPIGRVSPAALGAELARATENPVLEALLGAQRAAVVIVNRQRQIVTSNVRFLSLAGVADPSCLIGLRFGESLRCIGAAEGVDGCGTAARCAGCGAAFATLAGLRERGAERECSLRVARGGRTEDLALRVVAVPVRLGADLYTAMFVTDRTAERSRGGPDRSCGLEASRAAAELRAACEALRASRDDEALARVALLAEDVQAELAIQATLAGDGTLGAVPPPRPVEVRGALRRLAASLRAHPASGGRTVEIDATLPGARVLAVPAALHQVLRAMAVNAMEATRAGGTVRIGFRETAREGVFRVWNAGAIPAVVLPRLYQRFFSTKGAGRGQGTWAMRLLAEQVLAGRIAHTTSPSEGTWFEVLLPRA